MTELEPRPLVWVGSSKKDYDAFPAEVQDDLGYALFLVQTGENSIPGAKPLTQGKLKGLGIYELVDDFDTDTYRAIYTTKIGDVVYVLHAFKKKSRKGIATPEHEIELIRARFMSAMRIHEKAGGSHDR